MYQLFSQSTHLISSWYKTMKKFAIAHRFLSSLLAVAILGGGWWAYSKATTANVQTRYVLAAVQKGTIVTSVSASGQVSASDQVDAKAKSSGQVTWVAVGAGDRVVTGQMLVSIDATDAMQAVTNAELDLEQARITLEHDTAQAPIDYDQTKRDASQSKLDLINTYSDTYAALSDAYIKLPDVVSGADSILHDSTISASSQNISAFENFFISADSATQDRVHLFAVHAEQDYDTARAAYDASALEFKGLSRSSDPVILEQALDSTKQTAILAAQAVTSETNLIDTVVDLLNQRSVKASAPILSAQTTARGYVSQANGILSALASQAKNLDNAKKAVTDTEHTLALASIGNSDGTSPFSLELEKNDIKKKEAALADAQQALTDRSIRAPFGGIVAAVSVRRGDTLSSGATVATLITTQKLAELSLNEVDAAKIKLGDKATLTFDAIDGLTLTGKVAEVDAIGTVTQGVVSYTLKIAFDSQDERIKPGMTVNASIITDAHQDTLFVPASAVKMLNGTSYVQLFDPAIPDAGGTQGVIPNTAPQQIPVEIGLSDDANTEILSGLFEGQQIVARTVSTSQTTSSQSTAPSLFGGGATRIQR